MDLKDVNSPLPENAKAAKLKAEWDGDDDEALIKVLTADRQPANAPIGPENATSAHGWKATTWATVVEKLAGSEVKRVSGTGLIQISVPKTLKACKSHWYSVSLASSKPYVFLVDRVF